MAIHKPKKFFRSANRSGKTLTILLVVIAILLVSLTAISLFFFLQEIQLREAAENNLEQMEAAKNKLDAELKETKKQMFLMEEKSKESEDKIEGLMEDLEFEKGLREEIKKENRTLKDGMDKTKKDAEDLKAQLNAQLEDAGKKTSSLQEQLDAAVARNKEIEDQRRRLEAQNQQLKQQLQGLGAVPVADEPVQAPAPSSSTGQDKVDLQKIVVSPPGAEGDKVGKIISVDREANFIIVSLGEAHGIQKGTALSIYRSNSYLGDVQVTRVLPEMSAADFIPPLTSQQVQKDDAVVIKQ